MDNLDSLTKDELHALVDQIEGACLSGSPSAEELRRYIRTRRPEVTPEPEVAPAPEVAPESEPPAAHGYFG